MGTSFIFERDYSKEAIIILSLGRKFVPQRMRLRCNRFVPGLEHAELDPHSPIVQGLRPVRGENVRVERELRTKADGSLSRIVHSYGQGGSGFTLSFGCAGDVVGLIEEVEAGVAPTPLKSEHGAFIPVHA